MDQDVQHAFVQDREHLLDDQQSPHRRRFVVSFPSRGFYDDGSASGVPNQTRSCSN